MPLKDVWIKKVGQNRGRPRIYLDGLQAIRAGFAAGERFDVEVDGKRVVITKNEDGSRVVSGKRSRKPGEGDCPVLDINSAELLAVFEGMEAIRVVVGEGRVFLLPLASEAKKVERLGRLSAKLSSGAPLSAGSLAHGGGVLAHAVHAGLREAGIECDLKFANELRDDLLTHAMQRNDAWSDETAALSVPMQELAQDDWLMAQLPRLEILEMGLPCSGASLAGHSKNKLQKMEDHEEVGHLVHSALAIISRTNPAIVLLENVPRYKDTASAQILRHQFRDMGYTTHEAILDGQDFGCLEKRVRWCMVACTRGIEFSFEDLAPRVHRIQVVSDIIDPAIEADDPRWRQVAYLHAKEERNAQNGDRFKMQFIEPGDSLVPTLRRGYFKGGSSDPRLAHPTDASRSRLLTAAEHAAVKGVPGKLVRGLSESLAHQLLGQGIVYEPFRATGQRIGQYLQRFLDGQQPQADGDAPGDPEDDGRVVNLRRSRHTG